MSKLTKVALALALGLPACGPGAGSYCQSGPKYGTQCYSQMDLQPPGAPPTSSDDRTKH
jgi:hypothetical protein